ncbi:MAG: gamma-glutamyltransferase, partial [Candidatus Neomarinimicrobiota bacterium]
STIITTVLQVILNIIEHDMTITEAVSAPRVHSQWLPDVIMSELETMPDSIQKDLEFRGHKIISRDDIGSANGILINKGMYYGGPDPRWENAVVGY